MSLLNCFLFSKFIRKIFSSKCPLDSSFHVYRSHSMVILYVHSIYLNLTLCPQTEREEERKNNIVGSLAIPFEKFLRCRECEIGFVNLLMNCVDLFTLGFKDHLYIYTHICVCVYIYACVYIHVCVYIYICVYTHTHTYIWYINLNLKPTASSGIPIKTAISVFVYLQHR